MTAKSIAQAIRRKKPAIIRERGVPRYVLLDWQSWEELQEHTEEAARLAAALADPKNRKRIPYARVKKLLNL